MSPTSVTVRGDQSLSAIAAVRVLAAAIPVVGYGATAMNFDRGDAERTVEAAARLAEAALGSR